MSNKIQFDAAIPACSSELDELRPSVRASALRSLAFLAEHVLGLRIPAERCAELQSGTATASTPAERRAVSVFSALRAGRCPSGLSSVEAYFLT